MLKLNVLHLFMAMTVFSQDINLSMKNDKFYYKEEVYTGVVKEEKSFARYFTDTITTYEKGVIIAKKRLIYEDKMIGYTGKRVKDTVSGVYTWDFDNKRIKYKGYVKGMLTTEGDYNYDFKKIGVWKKYLDEILLIEEFNHDLLNANNRKSKEVFRKISEEEMGKIKITYPYEKNTEWFNSKDERFEIDDSFDIDNFTGTMKIKINGALTELYKYNEGVCYETRTFYYNKGPRHEMVLEKNKFGSGYTGYQRDYYYNGNIEEELTVTLGRGYTSPLEAFKTSFNPTGLGQRSVGFNETFSYSGPFKQYYSNGQLMVEGENYRDSQNVEDLIIYDIKGNRLYIDNE